MGYLIDSDWVVDHLAGDEEANRLLSRLSDEGIAISIITYIELYQGVLRSPTPQQAERKLRAFVDTVSILPITPAVARRCAHIRETLRKQRKELRRRAFDLLSAAAPIIALSKLLSPKGLCHYLSRRETIRDTSTPQLSS